MDCFRNYQMDIAIKSPTKKKYQMVSLGITRDIRSQPIKNYA